MPASLTLEPAADGRRTSEMVYSSPFPLCALCFSVLPYRLGISPFLDSHCFIFLNLVSCIVLIVRVILVQVLGLISPALSVLRGYYVLNQRWLSEYPVNWSLFYDFGDFAMATTLVRISTSELTGPLLT